jgi:peptide/nickel transport system permease protein
MAAADVIDRPIVLHARSRRSVPPLVVAAMAVIFLVVACALASPLIAPDSPTQQNLALGVTKPSAAHLLGTDTLGRDVLSRLIYGARTALIGPLLVALGGFTIAMSVGLPAGYLGGRVDSVAMRWVDLMYSLPALLVAIVVVGVIGGGYAIAVVLLMVLFSPADTRIVRGEAVRQRSLPYVEALRVLGVSGRRIMFGHIGRNVLPIVVAYVFLDFGFALVALSALSFLGIGVGPGSTDWGRMLYENRNLLFTNPAAAIAPGLAIVLTAASMNLFGDWLFNRFSRPDRDHG